MANRLARLEKKEKEQQEQDRVLRSFSASKKKHSTDNILTETSREFNSIIEKKSKKLVCADYAKVLGVISTAQHHRSLDSWRPKGKSAQAHFTSLCKHLLAKYPMPDVLWEGLGEGFTNVVLHIADGGSLYRAIKTDAFPVPLTKAMCHSFMTGPKAGGFVYNIRRAQFEAFGGDRRALDEFMASPMSRVSNDRMYEEFKATVIHWFCRQGMLDAQQIRPIIDYIGHRWAADQGFSMKGRSPLAILKDTEEWHEELRKATDIKHMQFISCGIRNGHYIVRKDKPDQSYWRITEILSSTELFREGRAMGHCVGSYATSIYNRRCSIFSIASERSGDKKREATLEIRLGPRPEIVQARARFNARISGQAYKVMLQWANDVGLSINIRL